MFQGLLLLSLGLRDAQEQGPKERHSIGRRKASTKCQEFVENWVMAARRQHPMMVAWKALFNGDLHGR